LIWDVATGLRTRKLTTEGFSQLAWSPDGQLLACAESTFPRVQFWDPVAGKLLKDYVGVPGQVPCCLAWDRDSRRLAWVTGVNAGAIYDFPSDKVVPFQQDGTLCYSQIVWKPDGKQVAVQNKGEVTLIDAESGAKLAACPGQLLTWATDGLLVRLLVRKMGDSKKPILEEKKFDDKLTKKDYELKSAEMPWKDALDWLRDISGKPFILNENKPTGSFTFKGPKGHKYSVRDIIDMFNEALLAQKMYIIDRGATFTVIASDQKVDSANVPLIWLEDIEVENTKSGVSVVMKPPTIVTQPIPEPEQKVWSPDRQHFASFRVDEGNPRLVVVVHDAAGKAEHEFLGDNRRQFERTHKGVVAWSPDAKFVAVGCNTVHVWDVAAGKEVYRLEGHEDRDEVLVYSTAWILESIAWTSDGRRIVTRSRGGRLAMEMKVWEAAPGRDREILKVRGLVAELLFNPDLTACAFVQSSGSMGPVVVLWDLTGAAGTARE
jgi:dipeptidyl aminopeptidase/acylaminoacyl peptidase